VKSALAATVAAALAVVGCGGGSGGGGQLKVSAASSLKVALPKYDPKPSYSFAGSDQLAAQIRSGARPDVFASANTTLPDALYRKGLVEKPVPFASNRLVLAVPAGETKVKDVSDLAKPGITIAAGAPAVPVGSYTREVIERLPRDQADAIEKNIRSNEPDVAGVVGKVTQHAVDAGFVYITDVGAASGGMTAIELPQDLQADVEYAAAVVKGSKHAAAARAYLKGLVGPKGQGALTDAGFKAARAPK
jgi:molybdate transport system substrate-binding protein